MEPTGTETYGFKMKAQMLLYKLENHGPIMKIQFEIQHLD